MDFYVLILEQYGKKIVPWSSMYYKFMEKIRLFELRLHLILIVLFFIQTSLVSTHKSDFWYLLFGEMIKCILLVVRNL